jgi:CheY-like chemotaxis protein
MIKSIIFRNSASDFSALLFEENAKVVDMFLSNKEGEVDNLLSKLIEDYLKEDTYTNILIPVSIGKTLSDFLGLRFATHIRTTSSKNQLANIHIYSYTGLRDLMGNECFNILNVEGVNLIDFSLSGFNLAITNENSFVTENQLITEIEKLKLNVPDNYMDSHSIANEWAMYRWSNLLGDLSDSDAALQMVKTKVNTNLYFKYLKSLHQTNQVKLLSANQLQIKTDGRILLIDDEANKGWFEIFCNLLVDDKENDVQLEYVNDDKFLHKPQIDIINICLNEIKQIQGYPDAVILDLRLHSSDFESKSISELTGFKILKEIKKINPGIQVIIFSATNKNWNLQALLSEGADGFVIKEGIENSSSVNFSYETVTNFIESINTALDRKFLKDFYKKFDDLKMTLLPRKNYKIAEHPLPKQFVDEVIKWLEMSYNILDKNLNELNITSAFIMLFSVLENISNRVIDVDNPKRINKSSSGESYFEFEFRKKQERLKEYSQDASDVYYYTGRTLRRTKRNIPWAQKILNVLNFLKAETMNDNELNSLVNKRNNIIHANSTTGNQVEISKEDIMFLNSLIYQGLMDIT